MPKAPDAINELIWSDGAVEAVMGGGLSGEPLVHDLGDARSKLLCEKAGDDTAVSLDRMLACDADRTSCFSADTGPPERSKKRDVAGVAGVAGVDGTGVEAVVVAV